MANLFKQHMHEICRTPCDVQFMHKIEKWKMEYEAKYTLALNDVALGINKPYFYDDEQHKLYEMCDVDMPALKKLIKSSYEANIGKVVSSPFNQICVYYMHLAYRQYKTSRDRRQQKMCFDCVYNILMLLHYKFFASLVSYWFKHTPNEAIMQATINSLSEKYHITRFKTWKAVIDDQCMSMITQNKNHIRVLERYNDDMYICRVISDGQTRIRNKVKKVGLAFHEMREKGESFGSYNAVDNDVDGKKILRGGMDATLTMSKQLSADIMRFNAFIDRKLITTVCKYTSDTLRPDMLYNFFTYLSDVAVTQSRQTALDKTQRTNDGIYYEGMRAFLSTFIQKTYRYLRTNKVNLSNKAAIIRGTKNAYTASRMSDKDILDLKNTLTKRVIDSRISRRDNTQASLRTACAVYLIVKSFDYI